MAAAYDTYDYPAYWLGREYEHESELIALKDFFEKIPKIKTILEIGAGYGRLTPIYTYRAKKVILTDPSAKLLKIARENFTGKKIHFIQARQENLPSKIRPRSVDVAVMVRVLHHIENVEETFAIVSKLLKKGGYFILEFANKFHFKAQGREFLKGNFTYPLDILPKDIRSKGSKRKKTIPFYNFHPDQIKEALTTKGFQIVETRSVSNIRSPFIKRVVPRNTLLALERIAQKPFARISFGPSIFILARKIK